MGRNHQNREFKHRKEVIKFIYNYECQCCNEATEELEVHHDDRNSANNAWNNLIPLCPPCHRLVHMTGYRFNLYPFLDPRLR